jgi:hypothetical protein
MAMEDEADDSILGNLGPVTWSEQDAADYEVALEGINHLIGEYSGLIGREERSEHPDEVAIAAWRLEQQEWAKLRQTLTPADPAAVQAAQDRYRELLSVLRLRH